MTGTNADLPPGFPDEATLARLAESFFGDFSVVEGGLAPATAVSGGPGPSGMPSAPAGSPGVPGLPSGIAPTDGVGLGGIDSDPKAAGSLPTKEMPDPATAAGLAHEPYGPGSPLVTPPGVAPPSQFVPDESLLTRLASQFFTALPGQGAPEMGAPSGSLPRGGADTQGSVPSGGVPPVGTPVGGAVPSGTVAETSSPPSGAVPPVGTGGADPASAMPVDPARGGPGVETPHDPAGFGGAPFDRPDFDLDLSHLAAAALDPISLIGSGIPGLDFGSELPGFDVSAPSLPSIPALDLLSPPGSPPVSAPSTPYYFLGETSTLPSHGGMNPGAAPETNRTSGTEVTSRREAEGRGDFDGRDSATGRGVPPAQGTRSGTNAPTRTDHTADRSGRDPGTASGAPSTATRPGVGVGTGNDRSAHPAFDVDAIRRDFPILSEIVDGKPLVWLDNAATTQKPQAVIDRLAYFYAHENSNIHRAAHTLAARATDAYEAARDKVARFLGAASSDEIVFVRGATEAINLITATWGRQNLREGDEIVISHLEHHANIVPWQQLVREKGAVLRVIPVDDEGQVILEEYGKLLNSRTKMVAVTHVSNALGTVVPVKAIIEMAQRVGACTMIDGAQSVPHMKVDVQELDADFYVFSGHKIFAPTGIGVVYGKREVLTAMPPYQTGGNMITDVTLERSRFQDPPMRFEAGTGNIADAVGLGAALDYLDRIGFETAAQWEHDLHAYATHLLNGVPGLKMIGTAPEKASVLSFVLAGHSNNDVGQALSSEGIAVRTGHHCAQPILRRFGLESTVRPSLAFYNNHEDVDRMITVLHRLVANDR
ncbi:MAG: family 2A encapsulin nanocompartment cargo protein cysteine desulfurase [Sporichthyaceae bacterium]